MGAGRMKSILAIRDGVLAHGEDPPVLEGVSLALDSGELAVVLGPNGSGKSTLLNTLAGGLTLRSGSVSLEGRALSSWPVQELARVLAVVPQHTDIAFPFTVSEVVLMGRCPHLQGLGFEGERDRRVVEEALDALEVMDLKDRSYDTCSGGERQRVLVARALAQEPRVLLLDEPAAHLDPGHQVLLYRLLAERCKAGLTACVVSHDWNLPAQVGDRAILLGGGRVQADGPFVEVMTAERLSTLYGVPIHVMNSPGQASVIMVPDVSGEP